MDIEDKAREFDGVADDLALFDTPSDLVADGWLLWIAGGIAVFAVGILAWALA